MTPRSFPRFITRPLAAAAVAVMLAGAGVRAFTSPAAATPQSTTIAPRAGRMVVADGRISLEQAVKMAEQKYKARVVRAESQNEAGRTVYVLRLLNDSGRVWTVRVDAATGNMI